MTTERHPVVLHVAPHPDDEVLGAGATLMQLLQHGGRVHSLVCTLGRPADHKRRRAELSEAAVRAGFVSHVMDPLAGLSSGDDLVRGGALVRDAITHLVTAIGADIVVSPHPHDGHHGHEAVGRAVREAIEANPTARWWMWGLWSDLPLPNLLLPFGLEQMADVQWAIAAYEGENARNRYDVMYPARATAAAVLGSERVLGFGARSATSLPYAELLTEAAYSDDEGVWRAGKARILAPAEPLAPIPSDGLNLTPLLSAPSPRQLVGVSPG